jgi:dolichol-phosphate mannosyltransferase
MEYKTVIGLPVYNVEKCIGKLLDRITKLWGILGEGLRIVVVNDGSCDSTESILKQHSEKYPFLHYLNHSTNLGLGKAVETLFYHVSQNYGDEDVLVTLDADNTHNPSIIPSMVEKLKKEGLDIVIASRFAAGGREIGLSLFRKLLSRGASLYCKIAFPIKNIRDYSCGYRAYSIGYLKRMLILYEGNLVESSGFECMVEILGRCSKAGVRVAEYPLVLEYDQKESPSKLKVLKTIMGYFRLWIKIRKPKNLNGGIPYE